MSSALTETGPQPLPRRRQVQLLKALALEAGWRHLALLSGLSTLNSLLDIAGLGLAVTLLLGSGSSTDAEPLIGGLPISASLGLLVGLILLRGLIQAQVDINRERLRSGFTDRLRQQLLHEVFEASSAQLDRLGRGELLALLMADINRTALSLDQAVRMGQSQNGKATGDAWVSFASAAEASRAVTEKPRAMMGHRYIELFLV